MQSSQKQALLKPETTDCFTFKMNWDAVNRLSVYWGKHDGYDHKVMGHTSTQTYTHAHTQCSLDIGVILWDNH